MIVSVCVLKDSVTGAAGKPITYFNVQEAIETFLASLDDPDFPEDLSDRLQFYETGILGFENDEIGSIEYFPHTEPILLCSGKEVVFHEKE